MIEYAVFILLISIVIFLFILNRDGVFLIVISNIMVFFIELLFPSSVYFLAYNTQYPLSIQLLTGIFTHYNYMHILINMVVLLLVGLPLEVRIGTRRFIIIYLFTGILSEIIYYLVYFGNESLLLGASGAIFGVMGALFRLYPDDEIPMFLGFIFMPRLKVKYAVFFYAVIEFLAVFTSYEDNIAHIVHISALLLGIIFSPLLSYRLVGNSIEDIAQDEDSKKLLKEIMAEKIPEVKRILLEDFLKKKCVKYRIEKNYVLCNGKKYRL